MTYRLERTMHLTHNRDHPDAKAVEENDPAGHYVLGGPGAEIPDADAKRYGLLKDEEPAAEAKAVEGPPENKAVSARKAGKK